MSLRFGDCQLDLEARTLLRGGEPQHLAPKAFELLKALIDARPRAVSKEELLEHVWPGVFVSDASLARVMTQVRSAIGDTEKNSPVIRTVHAYGYAFAADVTADAAPAASATRGKSGVCWLALGRRRFPLAAGEHIVGREPDAEIWLDSPKVSRHHAKLIVTSEQATIEDLGSKNGTFVRGERIGINAPVVLEPGDKIDVGPFALVFRAVSEFRSTETAI